MRPVFSICLAWLLAVAASSADKPNVVLILVDDLGYGDLACFGVEEMLIWVRREGNKRYCGRAYYAIRRGKWTLLQNTAFEPMQFLDLESDPLEQPPPPPQGKIADGLSRALMDHIQRAGQVPWQKQP